MQGIATLIVELLPFITVLAALGVWYGYELTLARARYFGLDPSVLDYTTSELLLRTAPAVIAPLLYLLMVLIALVSLHAIVRWLQRHRRWAYPIRVGAAVTGLMGLLLVVGGVVVVGDHNFLAKHPALRPMMLPLGLLFVFYATWLIGRRSARPITAMGSPKGAMGLTAGVVLISTFWSFSEAAEYAGARDSYILFNNAFGDLPRVIIYSDKELLISAPGVERTTVGNSESLYHWRYQGLRLLVHSGDKYFLIPAGWASTEHSAIVLADEPGLRFEFQEPERYTP